MSSINRFNRVKSIYRIPTILPSDLRKAGYETREGDLGALIHITNPDHDEHKLIETGPPGVGKTQFAKTVAEVINKKLGTIHANQDVEVKCFYIQCMFHAWISNEEIFAAPHIGNISMGNLKSRHEAYKKGILWLAAEASWEVPVVLLLDEFEKCQTRSENLVLNFLDDGIVQDSDPDGTGELVYADLSNIICIMTSNGTRELGEPTMRRAYRYEMGFLSPAVESGLLHRLTGAPVTAVNAVVAAANKIRESMSSSPSMNEMRLLLLDARHAPDVVTMTYLVKGLMCKSERDMTVDEIANLSQAIYNAYGVDGVRVMKRSKE
jgi:MoxR-like ATPase